MIRAALWVAAALGWSQAVAQSPEDLNFWFERMKSAAQGASYSGTFVYQSDGHSETSNVVRIVDADGVRERLEVMDGSPREVVRVNDEVRCYLPAERLVVIERRAARRNFPTLFTGDLQNLKNYYTVRIGGIDRIAGLEARQLTLDPKDPYRYGYRLWADVASGLLLKVKTVDDNNNQLVEQFAFTRVELAPAASFQDVSSKQQVKSGDWRVESLDVPQPPVGDPVWRLRQSIPGFVKISESMRRLQGDGPEVRHIVFSDGLSAISLFIGPKRGSVRPGAVRQGAVHIYARQMGQMSVTGLGEVPMLTVRKLVDALELQNP